jgi:hypothetical protein
MVYPDIGTLLSLTQTFQSGKTPTEIAALAWSGTTNTTALSGTIVPWAETEMVKATIIGDEFAKIEEEVNNMCCCDGCDCHVTATKEE